MVAKTKKTWRYSKVNILLFFTRVSKANHNISLAPHALTHRDLAFGLFCGGNENTIEDDNSEKKWSIPGAHTPVALMIHTWLETCSTWPVLRDSDHIPYHFEELNTPEFSEKVYNESPDGQPPAEILLPTCQPKVETNEPRRRKFSFWGDLVNNISFDWRYTLRVLRDCSDLVSAGWTPPPSVVGEEIIHYLILIAERGILQLDGENHFSKEMPVEQIRKERFVAFSCASESLVSLKTLASREVLPHAGLRSLVAFLCQLISMSETTSCGSGVQEDGFFFEEEILTQRTHVASNAASLLWILLSAESTSCQTTDALLDMMDLDLSIEVTHENCAQVKECVKRASGAIRTISAAMWGRFPFLFDRRL